MVTLFARLADDLFAKQCRKPHRWSALPGAADRSGGIFVSAGPENDKKKTTTKQNRRVDSTHYYYHDYYYYYY